jgi:protoporphyrinogen/coproporphyrinogen III oxidase
VVIIGGGITGLTAAFRLRRAADRVAYPVRCTILEASPRFGGKIETLREGPFVIETGPDSILARKPAGVRLIRDLGIESEVVSINQAAQKTYILHNGTLHDLPAGTNLGIPATLKPFSKKNTLVSRNGKLRALQDLVLPVEQTGPDISLGRLLKGRLGDEWVNQLCEPILAGIYAGSADDLSTAATFPQFLQMLKESKSLIRGSSQVRRRAQKAVVNTEETGRSAFITLKHGLSSMTERLFDCLQDWAQLETNAPVTSVTQITPGRYAVHYGASGIENTIEADAVLVTAPAKQAGQMLSSLSQRVADLEAIPYASTATVVLGYHKESTLGQFQGKDVPNGSGFVVPRVEGRSITACTWTSSKWPHTSSNQHILLRCYVGRSGDADGLALPDESMVEMVRRELREVVGLEAVPEFARVTHWNEAMPQYRVGHLELVKTVEDELAVTHPSIRLAGAGYHGVGIPDCIADGERAIHELWTQLTPNMT